MSAYTTEFLHNKLLVKGDFSGIQEFIFNTKSKGAAKTLKGKSFYIQILAELAIECIYTNTGITSNKELHTVYNGGGNFYLLIPVDKKEQLIKAEKRIHQDLKDEGIMLIISSIVYDPLKSYGENLQLLNACAQEKALNRFDDWEYFFKAKSIKVNDKADQVIDKEDFGKEIAEHLLRNELKYQVRKFGEIFSLDKFPNWQNSVNFQVPKWTKDLIEKYKDSIYIQDLAEDEKSDFTLYNTISYNWLGNFAHERTGTNNLGILKLDFDGLGGIIREIQTIDDSKIFSSLLRGFFEQKLKELFENEDINKFANKGVSYKYKDSISVIFAGGDDAFLVGSWDAIKEFSLLLKKEFDKYFQNRINELDFIKKLPTFSAGLIFVTSTYPVSSFSNLAEEALANAKDHTDKNALNIFNHTVDWSQWKKANAQSEKIIDGILYKKVPKSILSRLKQTHEVYGELVRNRYQLTTLTRFIYDLRSEKIDKVFINGLKETYQDYLKNALSNEGNKTEILIIPIAARLAEFSTRKIN
ncbi:Cas10/Cmr2 second palm domain-containing protein [Flectobacillus roseus]|uniref:GGDEF domain-containing protein n=1 Tax=Flectobacillus roseus TaxID=502259 RepID=A0ABT6Y5T7_9BACT|nr:hypothetical protein [Flectobacillus roseus]MDI9858938.1 hypothetical protein [Flectobacillus roseus]